MGGAGRSPGSSVAAVLSADCTFCSATARSASSVNCSVMTDAPLELVDDICRRLGICPSLRSSGAVMVRAVTSGLAPGWKVNTCTMG